MLTHPLRTWHRVLLVALAGVMLALYLLPLWNLTMFAPQYPHGLTLDIFNHGFQGGNGGQDVKEINLLNHYIGMRPLETDAFTEFAWMPFALGGVGLLLLRAATFATLKEVVDAFAVFVSVGASEVVFEEPTADMQARWGSSFEASLGMLSEMGIKATSVTSAELASNANK